MCLILTVKKLLAGKLSGMKRAVVLSRGFKGMTALTMPVLVSHVSRTVVFEDSFAELNSNSS
jgi:hypothetical protein